MKPLTQQRILVTGSTDGLGKQTALALARQGATVLLHGRNRQRLETTLQEIQEATASHTIPQSVVKETANESKKPQGTPYLSGLGLERAA